MSKTVSVPAYLADEYQMLTENIESYKDPEDPDAFKNYVDNLLGQLNKTPGFLNGMPDQLAICLLFVVKVNSAKLLPLCSGSEPAWEDVKTCVNVHKSYRDLLSTLSNEFQEQLKTALLLLCFYDLGAAKEEFHAEADEPAEQVEYEHQHDY
ncbi:hypothetical protein A9R00_09435 [Oleispira antarctica]|uniref:Uncharacterized protein n=1 Tax=Oleispira antarctica TaxID=188908 RepID=A0A1Y5HUU5_OLEAN|nr:hypothetical protein A9R00_09435 [Oleispira antarctica]